jgi:hypothetical protein
MEVKTVIVPAKADGISGKLEFGGRWCSAHFPVYSVN